MTAKMIDNRAKKLHVLQQQIDGLEKIAEILRNELKEAMDEAGAEEITTISGRVVRYQTITSNRFDSAGFKKGQPDLYRFYMKQTTTKRFTVA